MNLSEKVNGQTQKKVIFFFNIMAVSNHFIGAGKFGPRSKTRYQNSRKVNKNVYKRHRIPGYLCG